MSLPFRSSNMDPGNPRHAMIPPSTHLQLQPSALPQEMLLVPNDHLVMRPPSMHPEGVMPGLQDVSTHFGASQLYMLPNPIYVGPSAPSPFPIPAANGFPLGNFRDGGYMMHPQLAAAGGFQPVVAADDYQVQPQPLTTEAAYGMESTPTRKTQRMIKNRESAARSRARRQAYTSQLEAEIKDLKEKNDRIKENLKMLEADTPIPPENEKKQKLRACSSAEF